MTVKRAEKNERTERYADIIDQNVVLDLGFAWQTSSPDSKTSDSRLAARQIADFTAFEAEPGSKDEVFLFKVRLIVNTLGSALSRRLRTYLADNAMAESYRSSELKQIDDNRTQTFWSNMIWRSLVSGGIGFTLAAALLPVVQQLHANGSEHTTTSFNNIPLSLLVGLVFAAATKFTMSKIEDFKQRGVYAHYEWFRLEAERRYKNGQIEDYNNALTNFGRIYLDYTGKKPQKMISIINTIAEDIRVMERLESERRRQTASFMSKAIASYMDWRAGKRKIKEDAKKAKEDDQQS